MSVEQVKQERNRKLDQALSRAVKNTGDDDNEVVYEKPNKVGKQSY